MSAMSSNHDFSCEHENRDSRSWPHRLTVRTPGFHPGNRSSILREVTIEKRSPFRWSFFYATLSGERTPRSERSERGVR